MLTLRRANERGHAKHGWLESYHSFSFADYYDPAHMGFGSLRVINEDRVQPGMGFGTHGHRDMEIISYVLEGKLEHRDSMGTGSVIVPGDVQEMSAGRGVTHSEFNPSRTEPVHFLQIWIEPDANGIAPRYQQTHFAPAEKRGRWRLIASPDGAEGSVKISQDARVYAALLDGPESATHTLQRERLAYAHVARGSVRINEVALNAGDAVMLRDEVVVIATNGVGAEVLLFDLAQN